MNLRTRLLLYALGLIGALAVVSVYGWATTWQRTVPALEQALERKTESSARVLASRVVVPLATDDVGAMQAVLNELARDRSLIGAVIRDDDGAILAKVGRIDALPSRPDRVLTRIDDGLGFSVPIEVEGLPLGRIALGYTNKTTRQIERWLAMTGVVCGLAVIMAVFFAFRFSRSFVAPFGQMAHFTEGVAQGNYDERLPSFPGAELAQLSEHLNRMTSQLQHREQQLAERHSELARSTRLASVGEMAGRTAHEVLNPITSIQSRLCHIATVVLPASADDLDSFDAIVEGWTDAYESGGVEGLMQSLSARVPGTELALIEDDLEAMRALRDAIRFTNERRRTDVEFLQRESERIVRIVDGMRSLTRAYGDPSPQAVGACIRESAEILRDALHKRGIATRVQEPPDDVRVVIDRYELIQVLSNLMRNSMLAIEESRGRDGGRIDVIARLCGDTVEVRVIDDGGGIRDEHLPYLFEASFTTRGAAEGTGLGLSIARRLIREAGGELQVESTKVGVGSTFLIRLPMYQEEESIDGVQEDVGTQRAVG